MDIFLTGLVFITFTIVLSVAQLPTTEDLRNVTECDINAGFTISCEPNEVIAIHSLQYTYNVACESTCCTSYNANDCIEEASNSDIVDLRRVCTGKDSCTVTSLQTSRSFCSFGDKPVSYVILRYYCIPTNRIVSICANDKTLASEGPPLYITNEGFPGVTVGSSTCTCSFESYSCSSTTNLYTIDAELYLDTSNCKQTIQFKNGTGSDLEMIGCGSYYQNSIAVNTVSSHYVQIEFINNSTANQEGNFFIGLDASGTDTTFRLSCSSQPESWCVDCGSLPTIPFGSSVLDDAGNTGYQATASVVCSSGYETSASTISCLANATWESALCSPKDCGPVPGIQFGETVTDHSGNTTYGATATVTCTNGYATNKDKIMCIETGSWETSTCEPKDCGNVPSIQNGEIILLDSGNTSYGASANVTCVEGYTSSKAEITCLHTGIWEDIKECVDLQNGNNGHDGQDVNEGTENGGLKVWEIVIIVVISVVVLVLIVIIGIILYIKLFKKSKGVSPSVALDSDEKKWQDGENVKQEHVIQTEDTLTKQPLPDITTQNEVKHGPIYIEYGEAHVFGLTIHLPFAGKSAKQLVPIQEVKCETETKNRKERKRKKKAKSQVNP